MLERRPGSARTRRAHVHTHTPYHTRTRAHSPQPTPHAHTRTHTHSPHHMCTHHAHAVSARRRSPLWDPGCRAQLHTLRRSRGRGGHAHPSAQPRLPAAPDSHSRHRHRHPYGSGLRRSAVLPDPGTTGHCGEEGQWLAQPRTRPQVTGLSFHTGTRRCVEPQTQGCGSCRQSTAPAASRGAPWRRASQIQTSNRGRRAPTPAGRPHTGAPSEEASCCPVSGGHRRPSAGGPESRHSRGAERRSAWPQLPGRAAFKPRTIHREGG